MWLREISCVVNNNFYLYHDLYPKLKSEIQHYLTLNPELLVHGRRAVLCIEPYRAVPSDFWLVRRGAVRHDRIKPKLNSIQSCCTGRRALGEWCDSVELSFCIRACRAMPCHAEPPRNHWYGTVRHRTSLHGIAPDGTVRHGTVRYGTVRVDI